MSDLFRFNLSLTKLSAFSLFIYLFIYLSIYLFIYLSILLFIYFTIYLFIFYLFIYLFIYYLFTNLFPIYLFNFLFLKIYFGLCWPSIILEICFYHEDSKQTFIYSSFHLSIYIYFIYKSILLNTVFPKCLYILY